MSVEKRMPTTPEKSITRCDGEDSITKKRSLLASNLCLDLQKTLVKCCSLEHCSTWIESMDTQKNGELT